MYGLLKKISGIDLSAMLNGSRTLMETFDSIKKYLVLPEFPLYSDQALHEYLLQALINIDKQTNLKIKIYGTHEDNRSDWRDLVNDRIISNIDLQYLEDHFNDIFKNPIGIHKCNIQRIKNFSTIKKTFLSFRIAQEFYYIIYIDKLRNQDYYYQLFYSFILRLLEIDQKLREHQRERLKEKFMISIIWSKLVMKYTLFWTSNS